LSGGHIALAATSDTTVLKFGQSASLSGGQAAYGKDVRDGILAAFAAANRADPRLKFELLSLDDGGEKGRCKGNLDKLADDGVIALLGLTSGAAAEACLQWVEEHRIPMVGVASGNMGIRSPGLTMTFHVRSGYDDEYRRMVEYLKQFGMKRVGYVYLQDTSLANQNAMSVALNQVGLNLTLSVPVDRNQKSFEAEVGKLMAAGLDCVLFTTNAQPISTIAAAMSARRYSGMFFSSSFAGQALIDDITRKRLSVIMSQVVPRPNAVALPLVKRCLEDIVALGDGARSGFTSLEGYIVGRATVEAARKAVAKGQGVSRGRFHQALAELNVDLGGYSVRFGPNNLNGSHFVDVVAVDRTGRILG
jgi:ABC-type branched-subunit amino acid transport system substrate-binding protein